MFSKFFGRDTPEPPVERASLLDEAAGAPAEQAEVGVGGNASASAEIRVAAFDIGDVVRHRALPFRGVIFDVDPVFSQDEDWLQSIPEPIRPDRNQPFYHLLAENQDSSYIAYVSQQNLVRDEEGEPLHHPAIPQLFSEFANGRYKLRREHRH